MQTHSYNERPESPETYWDFYTRTWVEGTHCHNLDNTASPCKLQEGHVSGCFR